MMSHKEDKYVDHLHLFGLYLIDNRNCGKNARCALTQWQKFSRDMRDLVDLVRPSVGPTVSSRILESCPWLAGNSSVPKDADSRACECIKALASESLPLDSIVQDVINAGLPDSCETLLCNSQLINETSAVKIVNRFPKLLPILAASVRNFSSASLSVAMRTHLQLPTCTMILKQITKLLEAHVALGSDAEVVAPGAPSIDALVSLSSSLIDGMFVHWLVSGTPQAELDALSKVTHRMQKSTCFEMKTLGIMEGLCRQQPKGVVVRL